MRVYQTAFNEQDLLYYKQKDNKNKYSSKQSPSWYMLSLIVVSRLLLRVTRHISSLCHACCFVVHAIFNRCVTLAATCYMTYFIVVSRLLLRVT